MSPLHEDRLATDPAIASILAERDGSTVYRARVSTQRWGFLAIVLLVAVAPTFLYPIYLMDLYCFAIFACAFNLLLGYAGLLSFGHAAFFGAGSYAAGYVAKRYGAPPEFAVLAGMAVAGALGLVFGAVAIRRQGIYFAMTTLALAQMIYFLAVRFPAYTGGEDGIQSVPRGKLFGLLDLGNDLTMYVAVSCVFLGSLLFIQRVVESPFGQVLKSIRDNEKRAMSLGFETSRYKLVAFIISAALTGLAGATKVLVSQVATLSDVHLSMSAEPILMTIVGGLGTMFGPAFGAAIIVTMQNYLAPLGAWVTVCQGLIFILCVLVFRQGVAGLFGRMVGQR